MFSSCVVAAREEEDAQGATLEAATRLQRTLSAERDTMAQLQAERDLLQVSEAEARSLCRTWEESPGLDHDQGSVVLFLCCS